MISKPVLGDYSKSGIDKLSCLSLREGSGPEQVTVGQQEEWWGWAAEWLEKSFSQKCCILLLGRVVEKINFNSLQMGEILCFNSDASMSSWKHSHGDILKV